MGLQQSVSIVLLASGGLSAADPFLGRWTLTTAQSDFGKGPANVKAGRTIYEIAGDGHLYSADPEVIHGTGRDFHLLHLRPVPFFRRL